MYITENNLIDLQGTPVAGQRVVKVAPGVWLPVGLGGAFPPAAPSDSSSQAVQLYAGVIISDSGVLKIQPLGFQGTTPYDSDSTQSFSNLYYFDTGHPEPQGTPAGSSMDFYKCYYVNSDSWGGYKAVLNTQLGYYEFQSNSTEGLTYNQSWKKPVINGIYSIDALVVISDLYQGIPQISTEGLVFYASLDGTYPSTAEIGGSLTTSGSVSYSTVGGIPCASFNGSSYIYKSYSSGDLPTGYSVATVSLWAKPVDISNRGSLVHWGSPNASGATHRKFSLVTTSIVFNNNSTYSYMTNVSDPNNWHNYTFIMREKDGTYNPLDFYVDGQKLGTQQISLNTDSSGNLVMGVDSYQPSSKYSPYIGYLSSVRIYNRVLSDIEILALSKEFTPTT